MKIADFYQRYMDVPANERADYVWHLTPAEWEFVSDQIRILFDRFSPEEKAWRETLPPMLLGRPVVVDKEDE